MYQGISGHPVSVRRHWFARCESWSMRARDNFPVILFLSCRVLIHNIDTKIQKRKDLIKIISFKQTSYIRYRGSMLRLLGVSLFKINNWSGYFSILLVLINAHWFLMFMTSVTFKITCLFKLNIPPTFEWIIYYCKKMRFCGDRY